MLPELFLQMNGLDSKTAFVLALVLNISIRSAFDYTQGSPTINPPCVTQWIEPFGCQTLIVSGWQWVSTKSLAIEHRSTSRIPTCSSRERRLIGPLFPTRRFRLCEAHSTRTRTSFLFNSITTSDLALLGMSMPWKLGASYAPQSSTNCLSGYRSI